MTIETERWSRALLASIREFIAEAEAYPAELRHEKPDAIAFSATEIVYHMVDVEKLWQQRMHRMLEGTIKTFEAMDPDRLAKESNYNGKDYMEGIQAVKQHRHETVTFLKTLGQEDLMKEGVHSKYGTMNMHDILRKMNGHDKQHASQLLRTKSILAQRKTASEKNSSGEKNAIAGKSQTTSA